LRAARAPNTNAMSSTKPPASSVSASSSTCKHSRQPRERAAPLHRSGPHQDAHKVRVQRAILYERPQTPRRTHNHLAWLVKPRRVHVHGQAANKGGTLCGEGQHERAWSTACVRVRAACAVMPGLRARLPLQAAPDRPV
jgi:hypothetical protein